jgi:hypothetical protein
LKFSSLAEQKLLHNLRRNKGDLPGACASYQNNVDLLAVCPTPIGKLGFGQVLNAKVLCHDTTLYKNVIEVASSWRSLPVKPLIFSSY